MNIFVACTSVLFSFSLIVSMEISEKREEKEVSQETFKKFKFAGNGNLDGRLWVQTSNFQPEGLYYFSYDQSPETAPGILNIFESINEQIFAFDNIPNITNTYLFYVGMNSDRTRIAYAVTQGKKTNIAILDTKTGQEVTSIPDVFIQSPTNGMTLAYSNDGDYLVLTPLGSFDQTIQNTPNIPIKIFKVQTKVEYASFYPDSNHAWYYSSFTSDFKSLAIASTDHNIYIYDIVSPNKTPIKLIGHTEPVHCVNFSPDKKYIVSGSRDKTIKIWDVERQACLKTFVCGEYPVDLVTWHPYGPYIASKDSLGCIKIWNTQTKTCEQTLIQNSYSWFIQFNGQGTSLMSVGAFNEISFWDQK